MADRTLPNLGLKGFWTLGEDSWKDDNDRNLLLLSVLVQGGVIDKVSATPGAPTDGDVYLYDETHPTDPNKIAIRDAGAWVLVTPQEGWLVYNRALDRYETFSGAVWAPFNALGATLDTDGALASNSDAKVPSQKAVKTYVDNRIDGRAWKDPVRFKTTADVDLAGGGLAAGTTHDGVTAVAGDRALVASQTTASQNGIYVVPASGAASRATDADTAAEMLQASCMVEEGTVGADKQFTCTTNAPITLGTTSLTFAQTGAGGGATNLDALTDVDTTTVSPTDGQVLAYDSLSGLWKPATATGGASIPAGHANQSVSVSKDGSALAYHPQANYPDPGHAWFAPSGENLFSAAGQVGGDPQVLWDGSQWVMLFWQSAASPSVKCFYATATTLHGPWSVKTEITSLGSYHKPFVLVDEVGAPVKIGGNYHLYASYYNGSISSKEIYHFTAASLTGPWTVGSKVIAKGGSGSKDEYNADTPFAIYQDDKVYLWYMAAPTSSVADYATYGYATRVLRATATSADGPFTKDYSDVILPGSSGQWDYGWLGGVQIIRRPGGGYMMIYNAGDSRAGIAGAEPNTSRAGFAYADSLDGPWTKDPSNPYLSPGNWPSGFPDITNIWRAYIAYEPVTGVWKVFYNTSSGTEIVTHGTAGYYEWFAPAGGSNPYIIQAVTTSVAVVGDSRVNVMPGVYRVRYAYNIGDLSGSTPKLDVDVALRFNGTNIKSVSREFIGSYAYENRDVILEFLVTVTAAGYFDVTCQVTNGTPTSYTQIRRGRTTIERIKTL